MAAIDTAILSAEHAALTERCGLVDRSERGKLALTGSGAVEFLNGQVTNELLGMKPGGGCYAAFLTHKGKMLGDLRILAVGENPEAPPVELLLDTERVALQALFDMIRRFKVGYDLELHKRTLECSLLSLAGPQADEIAIKAFGVDPASGVGPGDLPAREHCHVLVSLEQRPIRLIRTDVGIDVLLDATGLEAALGAIEAAGAPPVSEAAAEIVRVERGRPRYGIDLDESTIPQEAGLNERAVSFTKGCYVGQETVARLHYRGKPNRHLRGLSLSEPVETGTELRLGERTVGHVASTVVSPSLGPIALALVRREAEPGASVAVGDQDTTGFEHGTPGLAPARATVTELPFKPI